jgi:hypothetical protein
MLELRTLHLQSRYSITLMHISSLFCPSYFGNGVLWTIFLSSPQTMILQISASQVAMITGIDTSAQRFAPTMIDFQNMARWNIKVFLICIWFIGEGRHFFMCLLAICTSENCLFICPFVNWLFVFLVLNCWALCICCMLFYLKNRWQRFLSFCGLTILIIIFLVVQDLFNLM